MRHNIHLQIVARIFIFSLAVTGYLFLFSPNPAYGLPVFAKKYALPCTACHVAFPKLNDFGIAFRDNGYQMGTERDTPLENPVISPFSMRTTPIFSVETVKGVPTDQNSSDTITTGSFNLTGLDILSAGVLARNISYGLVITPFLDNAVDLEGAWIRFSNIMDSSWINVKAGKHELDIPFSEKRGLALTGTGGSYLINHYHPGGIANSNGFEMGNNQYGIELMGHDKSSRIRYVIDLNNGSNPSSNQTTSIHANVYSHLMVGADQEGASERFGLLVNAGRWPTSAKTVSGTTLSGTGDNTVPYFRAGTDLALTATTSGGSLVTASFEYLYGVEDGRLICPSMISSTPGTCPSYLTPLASGVPGNQDAVFHGIALEINWMPTLNSILFSHYDRVVNLQQADKSMPSDYNDQTSLTLGIRYYLHISQATLVALHGEWSTLTTQKANASTGEDLLTNAYLVGIDYAF
jgi:hypothetical protein